MSTVNDLEPSLQALLQNKPPGVTKSKISSITALCVENVKSESVLVQKIYTHFKKTPATHKLGVLYILDSVTREWITKTNAAGQDLHASSIPDGTFAAGVTRVTQMLTSMMTDLIANAPEDQKDKISKLVGIWERGSIFPKDMLASFQKKLETPEAAPTLTPTPTAPGPAEILSALQQPIPLPVHTSATPVSNGHHALLGSAPSTQTMSSIIQASSTPPMQQQPPVSAIPQMTAPPPIQPVAPPATQAAAPTSTDSMAALAAILPPEALNDPQKLASYLQVLQQLVQMGVPSDQWADVISELSKQNGNSANGKAELVHPPSNGVAPHAAPLGEPVSRTRSRSPSRRDSPGHLNNFRQQYRERSPTKSGSPARHADKISILPPKFIEFDANLPQDHIKVLSRTLFVGGTTCPDYELGQIFSRWGNVQSVITNDQRRHAFVKMCTRAESVAAKTGMDNLQDEETLSRARSTKWGVGFGPRECCDYSQGVSVIPISRLTDADRRWILTAEYGGIGGREITSGLVMEEPDIEIGAGVSSKAISNRVGRSEANRRGRGGRYDRPQRTQSQQAYQQPAYQQPQPPAMSFPPMPQMPQTSFYTVPAQAQRTPRFEDMSNMGMPPPAVPNFGFQMPGGYGAPSSMPPYGR